MACLVVCGDFQLGDGHGREATRIMCLRGNWLGPGVCSWLCVALSPGNHGHWNGSSRSPRHATRRSPVCVNRRRCQVGVTHERLRGPQIRARRDERGAIPMPESVRGAAGDAGADHGVADRIANRIRVHVGAGLSPQRKREQPLQLLGCGRTSCVVRRGWRRTILCVTVICAAAVWGSGVRSGARPFVVAVPSTGRSTLRVWASRAA